MDLHPAALLCDGCNSRFNGTPISWSRTLTLAKLFPIRNVNCENPCSSSTTHDPHPNFAPGTHSREKGPPYRALWPAHTKPLTSPNPIQLNPCANGVARAPHHLRDLPKCHGRHRTSFQKSNNRSPTTLQQTLLPTRPPPNKSPKMQQLHPHHPATNFAPRHGGDCARNALR